MDYRKIIQKRRGAILGHWPSMGDAARQIGVRFDRLSRVVNGRVKPTPEEMRQLAWHLQVPIADLFPEATVGAEAKSSD